MTASEKYEMMLMYQHTYNWSTRERREKREEKIFEEMSKNFLNLLENNLHIQEAQ